MAGRSRLAQFFGAVVAIAAISYVASRPEQAVPRLRGKPQRSRWPRMLANVWTELGRDHVSVMAAGVAFYGFLAMFPSMSALISIYGLIADPSVIGEQMAALQGVLPRAAIRLISTQLHTLLNAPRDALSFSLVLSLLLAFWSAMNGTGTLMEALTVAFEERERRTLLGFYGVSAVLTIGISAFGLLSLFLIAVIPVVIASLPLPSAWSSGIALIRWPLLAGLVMAALGLVYRFAPSRRIACWHLFAPGTIAAAIVWLAGSAGFSFYVSHYASYDKVYGSLGAVVVLLMWLYVSAYIVLAGAELNSEIDQRRAAPRGRTAPGSAAAT
jgi:membrane protein